MSKKSQIIKGLAVAAITAIGTGLASLPAANAATYTLSACNGGLGCGTGNNFGTVTTSMDGTDTVKVDVDLAGGCRVGRF